MFYVGIVTIELEEYSVFVVPVTLMLEAAKFSVTVV
jgi:hypothetical protein